MKRLVVILMALSAPNAVRGQAHQPPSVSAARLHVSVTRDAGNVFVYRYALENAAGSNAGITRVAIDISMPAGASAPSATGLKNGAGYFVTSPGAVKNLKAGIPVPVGLSAPQPGWRTTVGTDATARWVSVDEKSLVLPKQRLTGILMVSHGPPSLRRFTLAPHVDPDHAPVPEPELDALETERYELELEQYIESRSMTGMTLAPGAPVSRTADGLLAALASQVTQARTLRWISSDAIAREITNKLQAARSAISARQPEQAGTILRALRTGVSAQSGKALTTEAVALVDLNIQYALPLVGR